MCILSCSDLGFEIITLAAKWSMTQGQEGRVYVETQGGDSHSSGDRSERIRTYNYPQGRVTDHRIGLTLYRIEAIMNGDLDEIVDSLITADQAEKLKMESEG